MITCERCGSVSGHGARGSAWICEDCRMKPIAESHEECEDAASAPQPPSKEPGSGP